ncbi:unnamed protein product, partial [Mesorhabditis spiculigera]
MDFGDAGDEDFQFGTLPEDDEHEIRDEIDAVNEETFGGDIGPLNSELSEYATQTASLRLDEWDRPGCSSGAAPEASQLPMPFDFDGFDTSATRNNQTFPDLSRIWEGSLPPSYNLWGPGTTTSQRADDYDVLKASLDSTSIANSSAGNFLSSIGADDLGRWGASSAWNSAPSPNVYATRSNTSKALHSMYQPSMPVTIEEARAQAQPSSRVPDPRLEQPAVTVPRASGLPNLPKGAMSADELERQFLNESQKSKTAAQPAAYDMVAMLNSLPKAQPPQRAQPETRVNDQHPQQPPQPPPHQKQYIQQDPRRFLPPHLAGQHPMQHPPPMPPHMRGPPMGHPFGPGMVPPLPPLPQCPPHLAHFMPAWLEVMSGKRPMLPHGVPPVPPIIVQYFRQLHEWRMMARMGGPPMGFPPHPPPHMQPHPDFLRRAGTPNRHVVPGMPSGKTIEDFAFEPFAGFMSCKEREWLVKIQLIQCQGSGNPYDDDFYYANWRDKQLAAGWKPGQKKEEAVSEREERGRRYREKRETERQSANGTPNMRDRDERREDRDKDKKEKLPFFAGSLGKPVSSTVYNPRMLIDVRKDETEEDGAKAAQAAVTQKKLRTMLLRLESAAAMLIECQEKKRQLTEVPTNERVVLENSVLHFYNLIYKELFTAEHLTKTLQLSKGRSLWKKYVFELPCQSYRADQICRIVPVVTLFNASSTFSKKLWAELSADLCPGISRYLNEQTSRDELISLIAGIDTASVLKGINEKNSFTRDLLVTLFLWCARRKVVTQDGIFQFLRSTADCSWDGAGWVSTLSQLITTLQLNREDLANFSSWLTYLADTPSSQTPATCLANLKHAYLNPHEHFGRQNICRAALATYAAAYFALKWRGQKKAKALEIEKQRERQNVVSDALARAGLA